MMSRHTGTMRWHNWVLMLCLLLVLPIISANVLAETQPEPTGALKVVNPGADLWREVRQRDGAIRGSTQMKQVDANVLIHPEGEEWRRLRTESIVPNATVMLGLILLALFGFRLVRGEMKISEGRSGKKILRFSLNQRAVHWFVAVLFVVLGLTGLVLLLGRTVLLPVIGLEGLGALAYGSKLLHNYLGPLFGVGLVLMLFTFIKGNFFKSGDLGWFAKGGGMLGGHASSGRYNAGEKCWFWLVMLGGAVVVASGLVLDFPNFQQTRDTMSQANVIHAISSVVLVAASFGHIYMGTVGVEGALETMTTGYCDTNWAKEHHDQWYEEQKHLVQQESDIPASAKPPPVPESTVGSS